MYHFIECICNGHANDCEYNTTQSLAMCLDCMDNTVGNNCELCVPGFYQDETLLLNDPAICIRKFVTLQSWSVNVMFPLSSLWV